MDFGPPAGPPRADAVLPMINLVFLLLIFFLMVATLAPRPPAPTEPPVVLEASRLEPDAVRIALGLDGVAVCEGVEGGASTTEIADCVPEDSAVAIHADRRAPAPALARLLRDLDAAGAARMWLVAEPSR
jgi:biopolymer transport protein ExbD